MQDDREEFEQDQVHSDQESGGFEPATIGPPRDRFDRLAEEEIYGEKAREERQRRFSEAAARAERAFDDPREDVETYTRKSFLEPMLHPVEPSPHPDVSRLRAASARVEKALALERRETAEMLRHNLGEALVASCPPTREPVGLYPARTGVDTLEPALDVAEEVGVEPGEVDLLETADARDWAAEFMRLFGGVKIDFDLMVTWFANAIMKGWDAGRARLLEEQARLSPAQGDSPAGEVEAERETTRPKSYAAQLRDLWVTGEPVDQPRFGERLRALATSPPLDRERILDLIRDTAGPGLDFQEEQLDLQERGGATYAYHRGEYVFRVTAGPQETITDLLRMAYNSGRHNLEKALIAALGKRTGEQQEEPALTTDRSYLEGMARAAERAREWSAAILSDVRPVPHPDAVVALRSFARLLDEEIRAGIHHRLPPEHEPAAERRERHSARFEKDGRVEGVDR